MIWKRSTEKSLVALIDRSFTPDGAAISTGRMLVTTHAVTSRPTRPSSNRVPILPATLRAGLLAGAAILVLIAVGSQDHRAPTGGVWSVNPSPIVSIDTSIGRSATDLDAILAAKGITEDELAAEFKRRRAAKHR